VKTVAVCISFLACFLLLSRLVASAQDVVKTDGSITVRVKAKELDELMIKGDNIVFSNFSLGEGVRDAIKNPTLGVLEFSCAVRNKSGDRRAVSLMVCGLDEKGGLLWSAQEKPPIGTLAGNKTDSLSTFMLIVPRGTKDKTATVWIRVCGDL